MKTKIGSLILPGLLLMGVSTAGHAQDTPGYNNKIPEGILTPDTVETSIGTLKFFDGAPYPETAQKVYDYLDTMRAVDTFLKGMPGASVDALIKGNHELGATQAHQVLIFDRLMDSNSLFLTGNTSTMYVLPTLDLERSRERDGYVADRQRHGVAIDEHVATLLVDDQARAVIVPIRDA